MGGCAASKLDNEDTVRRCKERRRLIKDAVYARYHLAAAQSDYSRSLRLTGSALADFAAGEPFSVSDQTSPAVILRTQSSASASSYSVPTTFSADRVHYVRPDAAPREAFYPLTAPESVRSMPKRSNLRSVSCVSSTGSVLNDRFKRRIGGRE